MTGTNRNPERDIRFMAHAIELARRAQGRTRPNPLVGCVIINGNEIVASGFHARAGEYHAEVAALENLSICASECELYVNLEPCSHFGRTPPCAEAIIRSGIQRVVIGTIDPNPRVQGRGVEMLRNAGIEVVCGVLEKECVALNAPFFKHITTGLPWVCAKYAMSLDGKIATRSGDSKWISSAASRQRVHQLRDHHDAVLVGTGTLLADDPRLTCRIDGGRDPVRVVIDAMLKAPLSSRVFDNLQSPELCIVVTSPSAPAHKQEELKELGVEVCTVELNESGGIDVVELLHELGRRQILSVLVEGGGSLLGSLFDAQLVDYLYAFVSPKLIGGDEAPSPIRGSGVETVEAGPRLVDPQIEILEDDVLIHGHTPWSAQLFPEFLKGAH